MNTAGQVGGALSPVVFAMLTTGTNDWSMPLYVTGVLYLMGALCWFGVRPERAQIAPGALAAAEAGT
jgi:sugar phosphate permease